jgi:hypothetical protein
MRKIDLTGRRFERLTVIGEAEPDKNGHARWNCRCDCGEEKTILSTHLVRGSIRSCGCQRAKRRTKHKQSRTKLYKVWEEMKQRCNNQNNASYSNYGNRGISVCPEWQDDFQVFYDWAMENGYADGLQIDRINNDGDYEPGNCRWVTKKENLRNKRQSVFIEYHGQMHTVAEWAKITGIHRNTIANRIRAGKTPEEIFKQPISTRGGVRI